MGFTPRRNPDIIVCVLFEGGEHGKLAARLATQVIKAYVDKQRRQPTKMAAGAGKVEVSGLWTDAGGAIGEDEDAGTWRPSAGRPLPGRCCAQKSSTGGGRAGHALTSKRGFRSS